MDSTRQKLVSKWLKSQQGLVKKQIHINVLLGALSAVLLVIQTWLLATILDGMIIQQQPRSEFTSFIIFLIVLFIVRAGLLYAREKVGFAAGTKLRSHIRKQILDKLHTLGPVAMKIHPAGTWATIALEQVESLHNFYARYISQQYIAVITPIIIVIAIFPINWVAGVILLFSAPLIPIFMILVGLKAAETSQRNVAILGRLSGQFLDRLKGLETLRVFGATQQTQDEMTETAETFRETTMDVLKVAFLSSAVLEFFTSISIAIVAVYFGFTYLGELNLGHGGAGVALFIGFFSLILAPEFYQPLRDLGTFYHDRSGAIAAADEIERFIHQPFVTTELDTAESEAALTSSQLNQIIESTATAVSIVAKELVILSPQNKLLSQPLNFNLTEKQKIALVGQSGAGKSSLLNVLLGFLPYQGSLTINGIELKHLNLSEWRQQIAWVGQNPLLLPTTIRENLLLGNPQATDAQLQQALKEANAADFVATLGLDYPVKEAGVGLSGGQIQRLAIARALLREAKLLLLDEPTASLDANAESAVLATLQQLSEKQSTIMVTHRIEDLQQSDQIWVMQSGQIIQQGNFEQLKNEGYFAMLLAERQQVIH